MQERLALEHRSELVAHTTEQLLDRSAVAEEGNSHLEAARRDVALRGEDVVGNPLDEVRRVLVLNVLHLLLDLLHRNLATEDSCYGEVATVPEVRRSHHVLRIEHLLRELRDRDSAVLLAATRGEGREAGQEEVKTGEGNYAIT